MAGPSIGDIAALLPAIQSFVAEVIANIEAKSPDVAKADEEVIRQAITDALAKFDAAGITSSLEAVVAVLKAGHGESGGGFDANLA